MNDTPQRLGRRTAARHGRLSAPSPLARLLRVVGIAMACVLVAGVGVGAYMYWDLSSTFAADAQVLDGQDTAPPDISALDDEGVNILLTGIDVCEYEFQELFGDRCPEDRSAYGEDGRQLGSALNDVNMLMHISPEPRKITVISFPRDLMIPTPECTNAEGTVTPASYKQQLNTTYQAGALACVAKTIDSITGIPELKIDYAATVTWGGVIDITNAIGGVDVCVANGINDYHTGLYLEPGDHNLVGLQALQFLRTRYGVGGSDLSRISNQQVYMSALARKLMSDEVLTNPSTLLTLARTTLSNVDPSTSLTNPVTLVQIAMAANDVPLSDIVFVQYPVLDDPENNNHVIPIQSEADLLLSKIAANESLAAPEPEETPGAETPDPTETPEAELNDPGRSAVDDSCSAGTGLAG